MKQIIITLGLIVATVAALAATMLTGSVQAAGALVLIGVLSGIWAVRQAEWWRVKALFAELLRWRSGDWRANNELH